MTINIKLNRETIGAWVSVIVGLFVFFGIIWFPDLLFASVKFIVSAILSIAASIAAGFGAYSLINFVTTLLSDETEPDAEE